MTELKKGDKVILKGFTGIKLGVFEISSTTKKTVSITKRNGDELIFDRKTGKQVNVEEGKEKYASSIMEDDGSYVAPSTRGAKKKAEKKKAEKVPAKAEPDTTEEDLEEEDEEEVKPVKKSSKKPAKKAAKKVELEDEEELEDEDEDEEDEFDELD